MEIIVISAFKLFLNSFYKRQQNKKYLLLYSKEYFWLLNAHGNRIWKSIYMHLWISKDKGYCHFNPNTKGFGINSRKKKKENEEVKTNVNPGTGHVIILVKNLEVFVVNH